jgi:hypothetical protein
MKIPAQPYRCALGKVQPVVTDLDAVKRSGWREQHILVVSDQDERLDFLEREFIRRIGERLYGSGGKHRKPTWGMDDVEARFLDAAHTAYRLPPVRVQGYNNPWMSLAMQTPSRYPDTERVYRPMSPSPEAIERMLETMKWVQWLEIDQRHLVWMRAKRYGWHQIGRRFACDRTTAWRRWQRALQTVPELSFPGNSDTGRRW